MSAPTLSASGHATVGAGGGRASGGVGGVGVDGTPPGSPPDSSPTFLLPTFLAAAAILAGSSALGTPINGSSWVLPLVEVVLVIWLVGVGGRLIRLPTAVTALLQLAGLAVALTSLFTSSGIGGVLPNAAAVREAGALLSGAWDQIVGTSAPAPATPELSFLIALAVGCAAFIADFLVAEARAPALVALPLLCLYSVPASIAGTMLPWYSFAVPAVLYAVLLAVTGHRDRRTGSRAGVGLVLNGGAIIAASTVAALVIAGSATVVGTTGRLPHTSGAGGTVGLSPLTTLRGSLVQSSPVNILTASGLSGPDYFKTVSLTNWTNNQGWSVGSLEADVSDVNGPLNAVPAITDKRVTVSTQNFKDRFLPVLSGTAAISGLSAPWDYDSTLDTVFRADTVKPGNYLLSVDQSKPSDADLEADTVVSGGDLTETGSLAESVRTTAQTVTKNESGAFDKARALQEWFTDPANGFAYSLDVKPGNSGDALVDFLTNKQGYCEQYASAMAVMLRSLNIPTRVVVGFTQGVKQPDGSYLVTSHDAHAWVEVKFEDNGWVRFDPTPAVGGQGGQQGFTSSAGSETRTTTPTTTAALSGQKNKVPLDPKTSAAKSSAVATQINIASGAGRASAWINILLVVLGGIAVLVGLLMLPTVVRAARRRRRLSLVRSGGPGAAAAAWSEIEDTAVDHGILPHVAESARVTANRLARRAHLEAVDRGRLRAVVVAAELEWYGRPGSGLADAGRGTTGAGAAATMTVERPSHQARGDELAAGVMSVVHGLHENARIPWTERIVPRSLRRSARQ